MPLFLNNQDTEQAITAAEAIPALENGLRQFACGDAIRRPRIDNFIPTGRPDEFLSFSTMEGGIRDPGYYTLRIKPDVMSWPEADGRRRRVNYSYKPGLFGGIILLYSVQNAEFLAIMNDGYVQHLRVACSAALGVRHLSRADSHVLGMFGAGGMARSYARAFRHVRDIKRIQAFSPTQERTEAYCREIREQLGIEAVAVDDPRDAARGADIVSLCTNSIRPVIEPDWIEPGMHITNVTPWELSPECYARIDVAGLLVRRTPMDPRGLIDDDFAVRNLVMSYAAGTPEERAKIPMQPPRTNVYPNAKHVDCVDWATGKSYTRERADQVTTLAGFSYGVLEGEGGASASWQGVQFSSVAGRLYELAREKGLGTELPRELFLQDIPT